MVGEATRVKVKVDAMGKEQRSINYGSIISHSRIHRKVYESLVCKDILRLVRL